MHQVRNVIVALTLGLLLCGCDSGDHEGVLKTLVAKMNELADVMASVKDEASSKAAAPKVSAIAKEMKALKEKADGMKKPSASEDKRLKDAYEKPMNDAGQRMMQEMMRVGMNPKLVTPELQAALQEMSTIQKK